MNQSTKNDLKISKKRKVSVIDHLNNQISNEKVSVDIEDLSLHAQKSKSIHQKVVLKNDNTLEGLNSFRVNNTTEQKILQSNLSTILTDHSEEYHYFTEEEVLFIQTKLLDWYDSNQRLLPWRLPSEPFLETHKSEKLPETVQSLLSLTNDEIRQQQHAYIVLVSEIMLQQTQ